MSKKEKMIFNDAVESNYGIWQFFKDKKNGKGEPELYLQYFGKDSDANVEIPITQEDFDDLKTLIDNVRMHKDNLEIERKFLLKKLPHVVPDEVIVINQYYGALDGKDYRIRQSMYVGGGITHVLCRKESVAKGTFIENEETIVAKRFQDLLETCDRVIRKTRYVYGIRDTDLKWEVDQYHDLDMVTAEVELPAIDHKFEIEPWMKEVMDREVTGDPKYFNSNLATHNLPKIRKNQEEDNADYLVWWTNQKDAEKLKNMLDRDEITVFTDCPALSYINDQFASRLSRNGRGHLWVDDAIPVKTINFDEKSPVHEYCVNAGGIVIRRADAEKIIGFPGIITDCNLGPPPE